MTLNYEIDSLDGLDEPIKALYAEKNGKFVLAIDGIPPANAEDVAGLKRRNAELLAENKRRDAEVKATQEETAAKIAEAARKSGDVAALEKSWQEKLTADRAEATKEKQRLSTALHRLLVENVATQLAADLAVQGSANVLLPHITSRLTVDEVDGSFVTRVLDATGKPSAFTVAELKQEIASNPAFAPILAGTKASGGGAAGAGRARGAKPLAEYTEAERIQLGRDNPAELERLIAHARIKSP